MWWVLIIIILDVIVTFDTVLTSMCGSGSMEIWFTCIGHGARFNFTMPSVPDVGVAG